MVGYHYSRGVIKWGVYERGANKGELVLYSSSSSRMVVLPLASHIVVAYSILLVFQASLSLCSTPWHVSTIQHNRFME
jgi:hypothetical protein